MVDDRSALNSNAEVLRRDGFRLISTRRAAIPIWKVAVNCRVLETRPVSTFDEFVLRAISLGVGDEDDLRRLLNLPVEVVRGVVSDLVTSRHVGVRPHGESPSLRVTPSGEKLVKTLVENRAVEKTLSYWVGGLSGDPVAPPTAAVLSPDDLDLLPRLVLEPDDEVALAFSPTDTDRFMNVQAAKRDANITLLTVIRTESASKHFVEVAALLFESESDSTDLYVRLAIDGRSDQDLEQQLRTTGVVEGLRLPSRVSDDRRRVDRALPQQVLDARVDDLLVERLLAEVDAADALAGDDLENEEANAQRDALQVELSSIPVRRYGCAEAVTALDAEIAGARGAILFSTSRLWRPDERDLFHQRMDRLLTSGVMVAFECPSDHMGKADSAELAELERAFKTRGLEVTPTKPDGEPNFVAIDGDVLFVYSGSPFVALSTSGVRLGDDRPTVVRGEIEVQAFISKAHGGDAGTAASRRSTVDLISPRRRSRQP